MRVLLVGAGGVGGSVTGIAARRDFFETMVVADYDVDRARRAAARAADSRFEAIRLDASDSVAVTAAYLIWREHMPMTRALALIQAHRPCACPNINFVGQLMALDKEVSEPRTPRTPRTPVSAHSSISWATPCPAT